jgi:hypothetical protein
MNRPDDGNGGSVLNKKKWHSRYMKGGNAKASLMTGKRT